MKNALLLTGAAARISQEVAIVDKLIEKKGLEIKPENTLLAGFSSGALNIGAINACFRDKDPLDWNGYFKEEVLFPVKTSSIYYRENFVPFNTSPLRELLRDFLNTAGIKTFDDCAFDSYVLAFSYRRLATLWASNMFNRHKKIDMLDLLMATSAIPLIFPDQTIKNYEKENQRYLKGSFADGGSGGSFRRFEHYLKRYLKQHGKFEKVYIVSPMRDVAEDDYEELNKITRARDLFSMDIKNVKVLRFFTAMVSQNGFDLFIKRFHKWAQKHEVADEIYVCIPDMKKNFPFLEFGEQVEQYNTVTKWIEENPEKLAVPLNEYVKKFDRKPLRKMHVTLKRRMLHRTRSFFRRLYILLHRQ
jgi:hypothetical protein